MNAEDDGDRVPIRWRCPLCGESSIDRLVWIQPDAEIVRCTMCGAEYDPNDEEGYDGE
ncbi:MAG: hypothetical protein WD066_17390 [Planctomycetaceae bacterium]